MRKNLQPDELGDLLEQPLLAILATHRRDGSILLSPVWHEWVDGGFSTYIVRGDVKSRHIAANPAVSMIVAENVPPYRSLEVRGDAVLSQPSTLLDDFLRIAIRYVGEKDGRAFVDSYEGVELELVRIENAVIRAWDFVDET